MNPKIYSRPITKLLQSITFISSIIAIAFILHGCQKNPLQEPKAAQATVSNQDASLINSNMVLTWNEAATVAVDRPRLGSWHTNHLKD